jgi:hypothetical protein
VVLFFEGCSSQEVKEEKEKEKSERYASVGMRIYLPL